MGQYEPHDEVITLEPSTDPLTGAVVFGRPQGEVVRMTDRGLETDLAPAAPVELPRDRFAGEPGSYDWQAAEQRQDTGQVVSMENGKLVVGGAVGEGVELPRDRFAAPSTAVESDEVRRLAQAGVGSHLVESLKHTSSIASWPIGMPSGWVLTTQPTSHGDRLTTIIARDASTGLYHAHLWRFDMRAADGSTGVIDLPAHLGRHPKLSAHTTHIYPSGRTGGILCLSQRTLGGLPTLSAAILQSAKWADGIGAVVRGHDFPFRQ